MGGGVWGGWMAVAVVVLSDDDDDVFVFGIAVAVGGDGVDALLKVIRRRMPR
jgi:hypothetical protein